MAKKYVIEATMCDTIRSVPLDKAKAKELAKGIKKKTPKTKIKIRGA